MMTLRRCWRVRTCCRLSRDWRSSGDTVVVPPATWHTHQIQTNSQITTVPLKLTSLTDPEYPNVWWTMSYRFCSKFHMLSSMKNIWRPDKFWPSYSKFFFLHFSGTQCTYKERWTNSVITLTSLTFESGASALWSDFLALCSAMSSLYGENTTINYLLSLLLLPLLRLLLPVNGHFSRWSCVSQVAIWSFSFTCCGRELLATSGMEFLWARCPSCQPTISVKPLKGTQSTNPDHCVLASSFLHPPPDSWEKKRSSLYTGPQMPVASYWLHFAWVVDDAKCIVVTRVCVSVCVCLSVRGRTPTLLHRPGCNLGSW